MTERSNQEEIRTERLEQSLRQLRALVAQRPAAWADLDLTMIQLKAVFFIHTHQPLTVTRLGKVMGIHLASASALADRLVRAGYVSRTPDTHDRRQVRLALTPLGDQLLQQLEDRSTEQLHSALERMSPRGRQALDLALRELIGLVASDGAGSLAASAQPHGRP